MKKVLIVCPDYESGLLRLQVEVYAHQCILQCLVREEAPFQPDIHYFKAMTALRGHLPKQGEKAAKEWIEVADLVAVYGDLGITDEMAELIAWAVVIGKPIEYRSLPEFQPKKPKKS